MGKLLDIKIVSHKVKEQSATGIFSCGFDWKIIIEPLSILRIIQLITSILAIVTTACFKTTANFVVLCYYFEKDVIYNIEYPFKLGKDVLRIPEKCSNLTSLFFKSYTFPHGDFSHGAQFFVATGVLTLLFTAGIMFIYIFMQRLYSAKPMTSLLDFKASLFLSICWSAGSCAWGYCIFNIKYYTKPSYLFPYIDICKNEKVCHTLDAGHFAILDVSLIFGFVNFLLWTLSLWFVYKKTTSYKKIQTPATDKEAQLSYLQVDH